VLPEIVPAEAASRPPAGIPSCLTRLIGREESLAELGRLLAASRLLTLTGPGGSGKTRLAVELARRVGPAGRPVTWVDLAALADPELLPRRVATALGLREQPGRAAEEALVEALRERGHLLVLDNCEHLVEAAASLVERLLASCDRLAVVVTSREALRIPGERAWLVPPLTLPSLAAGTAPDLHAGSTAVQLFAERAAEASRSWALDAANADAVARICRRLDGLPLAIELAAARVGVFAAEQIADRLDDAFRVLGSGTRHADPRHRTLRAAIDWSWSLLGERERRLLARLAVFAGGFTLEAAEAVGAGAPLEEDEVLDHLAALAAKSLVLLDTAQATPRYRLLETVRQYALERLAEVGHEEEETVRRRHADWFLEVAREAEPQLMSADLDALERLDLDHDNVRAALSWSRRSGHDATVGLPLAAAFHWYWYYRILWSEGLTWLDGALATTAAAGGTPARAGALRGAGVFTWYLGDPKRAVTLLSEAVATWREQGEARQLSFSLAPLSQALADSGELDAALAHATEAVALARRSPFRWDVPYALTNGLAFVHQRRGDLATADVFFSEAEAVWRADRHRLGLPFVLNALARLAFSAGDFRRAAGFARQALANALDPADPWFCARALRTLAYCELREGRAAEATRLLAAASSQLRSIGAAMMPFENADHDAAIQQLRVALPAAELAAAEEEGARTPPRQLLAEGAAAAAEPPGGALQTPRSDTAAMPRTQGRADPASQPVSLRVCALGPLEVTLGERILTGASWGATRAKELLFLLLCHPGGRSKEQVGMALWPDASTGQVHNSFHVTVHRLRKALGDGGWIVADGDRYRLDPTRPCDLDAVHFEAELAAALPYIDDEGEAGTAALARLEGALALYRGHLFDGEDVGDWHLELRDRLQLRFAEGLLAFAGAHARAGKQREAAEAYRRLLVADELHEEGCRGLMTCLARLGERAGALRAYRDLATRLWDELGTEPDVETTELFERLQGGERV
jgi:predicted ATPase/DNA-binding SARP family transcriptional activator